MGVKVSETGGGKEFKPLEAGTHAAICTAVVGVGPQETPWGVKDRLYLRFEVPAERVKWTDAEGAEHEGPAIIWSKYTASLNAKSNLRADLEGWRGRAFTPEELKLFDMDKVLGKPCLLTVVHNKADNGKVYANIQSISGLVKGMAVPQAEAELLSFDFDDHTSQNFDSLPKWLGEMVQAGKGIREQQEAQQEPPGTDDAGFVEDDIPF